MPPRDRVATAPALDVPTVFSSARLIGLASLVPGGFGSSDAFWIARLPLDRSVDGGRGRCAYRVDLLHRAVGGGVAAAALVGDAAVAASGIESARRIIAGLVGGGRRADHAEQRVAGASRPAAAARAVVPLPLVEAGQVTAALAGLLLLVLARGLARGYRAAFRATLHPAAARRGSPRS